jgi:hypothetical protein
MYGFSTKLRLEKNIHSHKLHRVKQKKKHFFLPKYIKISFGNAGHELERSYTGHPSIGKTKQQT